MTLNCRHTKTQSQFSLASSMTIVWIEGANQLSFLYIFLKWRHSVKKLSLKMTISWQKTEISSEELVAMNFFCSEEDVYMYYNALRTKSHRSHTFICSDVGNLVFSALTAGNYILLPWSRESAWVLHLIAESPQLCRLANYPVWSHAQEDTNKPEMDRIVTKKWFLISYGKEKRNELHISPTCEPLFTWHVNRTRCYEIQSGIAATTRFCSAKPCPWLEILQVPSASG